MTYLTVFLYKSTVVHFSKPQNHDKTSELIVSIDQHVLTKTLKIAHDSSWRPRVSTVTCEPTPRVLCVTCTCPFSVFSLRPAPEFSHRLRSASGSLPRGYCCCCYFYFKCLTLFPEPLTKLVVAPLSLRRPR